jgi:6-pyruvoyltetrahydropterin/6-carboxytetrahydropterin synthase
VFLESDELDRGFVTDFKHLGWLKDFLNKYVDHKFLIDVNDPAFSSIVGGSIIANGKFETFSGTAVQLIPIAGDVFPNKTLGFYAPSDQFPAGAGWEQELVGGFLFIDFVPTSENLSKWLFDAVDLKMHHLGVTTTQIDWYETPKSRSTYMR